jgi:hypothetical protein
MSRKVRDKFVLSMILFLTCIPSLSLLAGIDPDKVDLMKLTQETQRASQETNRMQLVWWIPTVYWSVSFSKDATVSRADAQKVIEAVQDYMIVVIVDGDMGDYGNISYRSPSSIQEKLSMKDKNGKVYKSLSESEIKSDTREMLSAIKPVFANMLGNMGQNLHFYVFPGKDPQNKWIADPLENGEFTVVLDDKNYRWKLPLTSLFPMVVCDKCKENCSGAWSYCPWCGTKLAKP